MAKRQDASTGEIIEDQAKPAASSSGAPTMMVKVYAPFQIYFEGDAYSISAINETGPFDVLPGHHNFLCKIVPCTILIKAPDTPDKSIKIARAIMHVKANKVTVFVDV